MRKLTKTIALASLIAPASAFSLGVGDIKLHSALNQNLNAEIALMLSANENPADVKVKLAPPDKFDEAGIPWSYFLSKIKFDLVTRPDGSAVIKLSSAEVLSEPVLDFLVEVSWPQGNLYREFTVLVDPPATYRQAVVPVATDIGEAKAASDYGRAVERTAQTASVTRAPVTEYGPVTRRDTLWGIAEKINPTRDASVEQVIMALYEANPNAFFQNNVNALSAGAKLKVPDREAIFKLSRKQALAEFSRQTKVWNGQVSEKAAPEKPVIKADFDAQLKLLAPTEADVADDETVISGDQDTTAAPVPAVSEPVSEQPEVGETETANADLQNRLEKLEQQLAMMQQMLALKDEQLAALQNKQQTPSAREAAESSAEGKAPAVQPVSAEPVAKPVTPRPVGQAEPESTDDSSLYYWLLGLGLVGALGGVTWFGWRKRQVENEIDTESMFAASSQISLPESEEALAVQNLDDETAYDVGTVGESSFLSEFTPSDFDAFDNDQHEVDPISEADVYLAYGRYSQAEDLIRHAIAENPENDGYQLKLLEIFYANEDKEGFEQYAQDLLKAGKKADAAFWEKVVDMGNEISPDSALFSSDFNSEPVSVDAEESTDQKSVAENTDDSNITDDIDFDLASFDLLTLDEPDQAEEKKSELSEIDEQDLDLDAFNFDEDKSVVEAQSAKAIALDDKTHEFELSSDVQLDESIGHESSEPEQQAKADIESFDFDFSLPEVKSEKSGAESESQEDENTLDGLTEFDFDFEESSGTKEEEDDERLTTDLELGVSDLTDMDEFETKIDLAQAYIDMGDADAAMDIAQEVLEKGNAEQKTAAQAILDELASASPMRQGK